MAGNAIIAVAFDMRRIFAKIGEIRGAACARRGMYIGDSDYGSRDSSCNDMLIVMVCEDVRRSPEDLHKLLKST